MGPQYLVETKVAPHAKAQDKPPTPKPLHPPLKLDPTEHTPQDEWATHYIIPHSTTRKNDAAKVTVTRHLPHTTQVYELTARNVLVTRRRHDERYTGNGSLCSLNGRSQLLSETEIWPRHYPLGVGS